MDDLGRTGVREDAIPVAVHLIETMHRIILFSQGGAAVCVVGYGNRGAMPEDGELVGEIVHVNRAVRAEIVVENEKNIAHEKRGL